MVSRSRSARSHESPASIRIACCIEKRRLVTTHSQPLAPVRPLSAASTPAKMRSRWFEVGSSSRAAFKTARRIELVLDLAEREGKVVSSGP
jgi:hypothetical protein